MQLKGYQQQTLRDLEQYIETLNNSKSLSVAFSQYWAEKGVSVNSLKTNYLRPYINNVNGVPRVTLKVPTAGGKTFIACNAIKRIMDNLKTGAPNQVVAWFVPSDTILKQTLRNLQDASHPYRQTSDALFSHKVVVVDKEAALMGQGINPIQMHDNLTIFVLSAQSFIETIRAKKDKSAEQLKPRAFRENGNGTSQHRKQVRPQQETCQHISCDVRESEMLHQPPHKDPGKDHYAQIRQHIQRNVHEPFTSIPVIKSMGTVNSIPVSLL